MGEITYCRVHLPTRQDDVSTFPEPLPAEEDDGDEGTVDEEDTPNDTSVPEKRKSEAPQRGHPDVMD